MERRIKKPTTSKSLTLQEIQEKVIEASQEIAKSKNNRYMPRLNFTECLAFCGADVNKIRKVSELAKRYGNQIPLRKFARKLNLKYNITEFQSGMRYALDKTGVSYPVYTRMLHLV